MKSFFDLEYNPKIDYLITKNLLYQPPKDYNEFEVRRAFKKRIGFVPTKLRKIRAIRKCLQKRPLSMLKQKDYEKAVRTITGENYRYHYMVPFKIMTVNELAKYACYLQLNDSYKVAFACFSLMILFTFAKEDQVIIPYRGMVKKCLNSENPDVERLLLDLKERTSRSNTKHSVEENRLVRKTIKEKKEEFLKCFPSIKDYGVYGSFAMKKENEYSDVDMLVICDDKENSLIEHDITVFWHKYFDINIDIKIVTEESLEQELTECMKKTLRMVK